MLNPLIEISNLQIGFSAGRTGTAGVSLTLYKGETLGLVGESGSGKSLTALSVMRLLPEAATILSGSIRFFPSGNEAEAQDLLQLPESEMRRLRGSAFGMIFQEPMTSLNPVMRCGLQVAETLTTHLGLDDAEAYSRTLNLFERVRLPDPQRIFNAYPHTISGGQKQRVMIAMALACRPALLIADEPTTALDVTIQKSILDLLLEMKQSDDLSMLFISHDLGVIREIADRVAVMKDGRIVETGLVNQVLEQPEHPYTKGLVACRPSLYRQVKRLPTVKQYLEEGSTSTPRVITQEETQNTRTALYTQEPLIRVQDLTVRYPTATDFFGRPKQWTEAVSRVSFEVYPGECFGLAGESGCGKTSLGRALAKLIQASGGQFFYKNRDLLPLSQSDFRPYRREIQMVFQDPKASLNPRLRVGEAILEPLWVHKLVNSRQEGRARVEELLGLTGLRPEQAERYPHALSGGERQRVCIARALALSPRVLICDEIVSALDVSVQAEVLNLLADLRERLGITCIFISHDLSVIRQMCDRLMIMQKGRIEALGFPEDLYSHSQSQYVNRLLEAVPGYSRKGG